MKILSEESQRWYDELIEEYDITDSGGLTLARNAAECLDIIKETEKLIQEQGYTFKDRFGQLRSNPVTSTQRDARSQLIQSLKALNLNFKE